MQNSLHSSTYSLHQLGTLHFQYNDPLKGDPSDDYVVTDRRAPAMEAIRIVKNGTRFTGGHFVLSLPWKKATYSRSGNYESALVGLNQLTCRLIRDEALRNRYVKLMNLMIDKGYVIHVPAYQLYEEYPPKLYCHLISISNMFLEMISPNPIHPRLWHMLTS
ncbi:unnamed protein product [Echinostoma caproni]|uniref:Helitron_like_N domain-containing protein n=1 Tax=Echinostoma caproni TaxID=27848 RepID=A0A183B1H7_9TREM|nr:unnamed protein product [Echinostoma caproni]